MQQCRTFPKKWVMARTIPTSSRRFQKMKRLVEDHGLELFVFHANRIPRDRIIHGWPGRDEQIERWIKVMSLFKRLYQGVDTGRIPVSPVRLSASSAGTDAR